MITNLSLKQIQRFLIPLWSYINYIINQLKTISLRKKISIMKLKTFLVFKNPLRGILNIFYNHQFLSYKRSFQAISFIIFQPIKNKLIFLYQRFINIINLKNMLIFSKMLRIFYYLYLKNLEIELEVFILMIIYLIILLLN